ncbi:MAG: hypothetical protein WC867_04540 [Candidatus Pacearchaeota archaeon]|jgi:hypothetical protein
MVFNIISATLETIYRPLFLDNLINSLLLGIRNLWETGGVSILIIIPILILLLLILIVPIIPIVLIIYFILGILFPRKKNCS